VATHALDEGLGVAADRLVDDARHGGGGVPGERGSPGPRHRLVLGVGVGEGRALHRLRGHRDLHVLEPVDLDESVVEGVGRVDRVHDLFLAAPTLGRALLEEAERVTVAVVDVAQRGLLHGRRDRDRRCAGRQATTQRARGEQRGVVRLLVAQREPDLVVDGGALLLRERLGVERAQEARHAPHGGPTEEGEDAERHEEADGGAGHAGRLRRASARAGTSQLACSSALRRTPAPSRATASMAPVTELRRNSSPETPASSRALTTVPLRSAPSASRTPMRVSFDAAVTYRPDSTTQSSPSGLPRPALAPSSERLPTEVTSVPPPESVPMIEAPPPTSEPSPTTTPEIGRASGRERTC